MMAAIRPDSASMLTILPITQMSSLTKILFVNFVSILDFAL
jgi:hypothetical protein